MSTASIALRPLAGQSLRISSQPRPVPIHSAAGRVVGTVRVLNGRPTFVKTVNPELHMLRHPPAWSNDRAVLERAASAGAELVCHRERGSRRQWWAALAEFFERGFPVQRGCGEQVGLELKHWRIEDPNGPEQLALFAETAP